MLSSLLTASDNLILDSCKKYLKYCNLNQIQHIRIAGDDKINEIVSFLEHTFLDNYSFHNWKQHKLNPKIMNDDAVDWYHCHVTI